MADGDFDDRRVVKILDFTLKSAKDMVDSPPPGIPEGGADFYLLAMIDEKYKEDRRFSDAPQRPSTVEDEHLKLAFSALKEFRSTPDRSQDSELAAAEHYIFMRKLARVSGDPLTLALPAGYHVKKSVMFALGRPERMAVHKDNLPHPPSWDVLGWAQRGAREGLVEHAPGGSEPRMRLGSSVIDNHEEIVRGLTPWQAGMARRVIWGVSAARRMGSEYATES